MEESTFKVGKVIPVTDPALIDYFWNVRGINPNILKEHCKEMHYTVKGYNHKAICFENNIGGYEIRSPKFKGGFGNKDVTFKEGVGEYHKKYLNIFGYNRLYSLY